MKAPLTKSCFECFEGHRWPKIFIVVSLSRAWRKALLRSPAKAAWFLKDSFGTFHWRRHSRAPTRLDVRSLHQSLPPDRPLLLLLFQIKHPIVPQGLSSCSVFTVQTCLATMWSEATVWHTSPSLLDSMWWKLESSLLLFVLVSLPAKMRQGLFWPCRHTRTVPMFVPEPTWRIQKFTRWETTQMITDPGRSQPNLVLPLWEKKIHQMFWSTAEPSAKLIVFTSPLQKVSGIQGIQLCWTRPWGWSWRYHHVSFWRVDGVEGEILG